MRILLVGYGKMGKTIEALAIARGHSIVGKIDPVAGLGFNFQEPVDVAIEFSVPSSAPANIKNCIEHHIPVLSGTTGWLEHKQEINQFCLSKGGTFFYASNFSLGVNLFFKLNEALANWMAQQSGYQVTIEETHHTQKKDAPSGTAITLAEGILKHLKNKKQWVNHETQKPDDLVIHSFREDPAPGTHVVKYQSTIDDLEIRHTAHSREGFAAGAVLVAEWLPKQKGVLGMEDFLKF